MSSFKVTFDITTEGNRVSGVGLDANQIPENLLLDTLASIIQHLALTGMVASEKMLADIEECEGCEVCRPDGTPIH